MENSTLVSEFRLKLYVKNFEMEKDFYENILQYKLIKSWDRAKDDKGAMFDTGAAIIELLSTDQYKKVQGADVSLRVKDVWKLYEQLKDKCKVIKPLRNREWGDTDFKISDPEGFNITFFSQTKNGK